MKHVRCKNPLPEKLSVGAVNVENKSKLSVHTKGVSEFLFFFLATWSSFDELEIQVFFFSGAFCNHCVIYSVVEYV